VDAAKEFLLHFTENYAQATDKSSCTISPRSRTAFPG
jgi:hypothetical protein